MKFILCSLRKRLILIPAQAFARDWRTTAKVTSIDFTNMPVQVSFKVDQPVGSCFAGAWLWSSGKGVDDTSKARNAEAGLAALIAAKSTGQTVILFGNNTGCTVGMLAL